MRLLFEIGMEENPARFLVKALDDLKKNLENKLKNERIKYDDIKTLEHLEEWLFLLKGLLKNKKT